MIRVVVVAIVLLLALGSARAEKRVALVIGIDKYDNLAPAQQLQRAASDARSVSERLSKLEFQVVSGENLTRGEFSAKLQTFLDKIEPDDTAAVYFSGHGVEVEGLNFLLPRDVPKVSYGRQEQLKRESISVSELLLDLHKRKPAVTILILDACRNHPLVPPEGRSTGDIANGLAKMEAPEGTFIMYSAGAGETALDRLPGKDRDNSNSVYTRHLLPLLIKPGLSLPSLARQLRSEVSLLASTVHHIQRPAYYDGLVGQFCFAKCNAPQIAAPPRVEHENEALKKQLDILKGELERQQQKGTANTQEIAKLKESLAKSQAELQLREANSQSDKARKKQPSISSPPKTPPPPQSSEGVHRQSLADRRAAEIAAKDAECKERFNGRLVLVSKYPWQEYPKEARCYH